MMRFKLCYEISSTPGQYISPQLLPISKPEYAWDTADNLILRYRYDFMPKGILSRFIVETHQLIEDHVWKNGVVLADKWARAEIIENYPQNQINVRVTGSNKKPLLERVRYELWKIHESYERLEYKELIPCNCSQCKDSKDPESYAYDLLMKYIGDRRYDIECRASYAKVDVRRLISDITDQSTRNDMVHGRVELDPMDVEFRHYLNRHPVYIDRSTHTTNQYGDGDNVARDKASGDKIDTQINHPQDLTQLSNTLNTLLENLSEEYNATTAKGQTKIKESALETIRQDLTLQQRLTDAFKAGSEEALEQMITHPLAKVLIESCKGFIKTD